MNDVQLDSDGDLLEKPAHEERISIALLMLWTAMTAALLGYDRATNQQMSGVLGLLPQLAAYASAPLIAIGLSAWVLMLWRWFTEGPKFPSQPGHWLLLLFGFSSVMWIAQRALVVIALAGLQSFTMFLGVHLIVELFVLLLYFLACSQTRDRWRWLFGLGMVTTLLALLSTVFAGLGLLRFTLHQLLAWLFCLVMVGLAIADLREGRRRDALHWIGIVVVNSFLIYNTVLPWVMSWMYS